MDNENTIKWEKIIAKIIENLYQGGQHFISAYENNPKKVQSKIISKLKVVPINIQSILNSFYIAIKTQVPDDYKTTG